jgi:hypothetical protein
LRGCAIRLSVALLLALLSAGAFAGSPGTAAASGDLPGVPGRATAADPMDLAAPLALRQAQLTGYYGAAADCFGDAVSIDGDTAVIGAPYDDLGAAEDAGSAFVFIRSGTVWSQQALLVAADGHRLDHFGIAVSIDGDTILVGASGDVAGSVYVFTRTGTVWSQQAKLVTASGVDRHHRLR